MNVTVYLASAFGDDPAFENVTVEVGTLLGKRGDTLVYGGTHVGLMGHLADTVLECGGHAIGVLPEVLEEREIAHEHLDELYHVQTMDQRKAKMIELGDVFVVLPGGPGTLEEFSEIVSLAKVGLAP